MIVKGVWVIAGRFNPVHLLLRYLNVPDLLKASKNYYATLPFCNSLN